MGNRVISMLKITQKGMVMRKFTMCLCEGRHEMPSNVEGAIFPKEIDPLDLHGMREIVYSKLQNASELDLYVTGLTVALCEVIRYCVSNAIPLTLYHFDKASGRYYPQPMFEMDDVARFDYDYRCVTGAPLPE